MSGLSMVLADGTTVPLNPLNDPVLQAYLEDPKAQVKEMVDQINRRAYYASLFAGRQGLKFLDLGANLGLVSVYAAPACERIIAVEPEPKTYSMLRLLTKPWWPKIVCIHGAVWPISGTVGISVDHADYSCHTVVNRKPKDDIVAVPSFNWWDLLASVGIEGTLDVCKVDIEGAEMEVLHTGLLDRSGVKSWYIECHKTPFQSREQSVKEMAGRLKVAGYSLVHPRDNALIATRH